jgi:hypothetical protein
MPTIKGYVLVSTVAVPEEIRLAAKNMPQNPILVALRVKLHCLASCLLNLDNYRFVTTLAKVDTDQVYTSTENIH